MQLFCRKDEGRSLRADVQPEASNHASLLQESRRIMPPEWRASSFGRKRWTIKS